MKNQDPDKTALSRKEMDVIERYAKREGIGVDEAATQLAKAEIAARVKKRTGKTPARVYPMRSR